MRRASLPLSAGAAHNGRTLRSLFGQVFVASRGLSLDEFIVFLALLAQIPSFYDSTFCVESGGADVVVVDRRHCRRCQLMSHQNYTENESNRLRILGAECHGNRKIPFLFVFLLPRRKLPNRALCKQQPKQKRRKRARQQTGETSSRIFPRVRSQRFLVISRKLNSKQGRYVVFAVYLFKTKIHRNHIHLLTRGTEGKIPFVRLFVRFALRGWKK